MVVATRVSHSVIYGSIICHFGQGKDCACEAW